MRQLFCAIIVCCAAMAFNVATAAAAGPPAPGHGKWEYLLGNSRKCPGADTKTTKLGAPKAERIVICLTNYARKKKKIPLLRGYPLLQQSSAQKSKRLIHCKAFTHTPCGDGFEQEMRDVGYIRSTLRWGVGENLAWSSITLTPKQVVRMWLYSDGHRHNLLYPHWRHIGVDVRHATFLGYPGSEIWVQHFGWRSAS